MGCKTKEKGDISEALVLAEIIKMGYSVLVPFGDNQPFDLVVVINNNKFIRLQCKSGWMKNGTVVFKTCSSLPRSKGKCESKNYVGLIDYFAIHCEGKFYLLPVEDAPKSAGTLRLDAPKNNQLKNVKFAANYLLSKEKLDSL